MKRRNFLKNSGIACGAMAMPIMANQSLFASPLVKNDLFNIPRPIDTRLNIKPLFGQRIPAALHEGPCRPADPTGWDKQRDKNKAREEFSKWQKTLAEKLQKNVNILDPVYVEFAGNHEIDKRTWEQITAQDKETDLYVLSHYRIPNLGKHTDKPIVLVGNACATLDVPANLNKKGETVYGAVDYNHLAILIDCLKVKKALAQTKLLMVTNGEWDYEYNSVRSKIETKLLKERFGIEHQYISIQEMMDKYVSLKNDTKFANEAKSITEQLIQQAEKNTMKSEDIERSVLYYLTAKKKMEQYNCNSFTATCQEFCVTTLPMQHRVTPCLTHSLLKDEGYISACEADTNVFLAMALQMYLSDKSAYMGNTLVHDLDKNLLAIHHDVPGIKMNGFDKPDMPYRIVSFTERNWGATLRYDFARDKGKEVTFCRMTPDANKMLIVKGTIEDCLGLDDWGCSLKVVIKVSDALQYFTSAQQTGHHFSMIYDDHTRDLKILANILNIETEIIA